MRLHVHMSQVAHQSSAYPRFGSMKRPAVFLLPLDGMLHVVHHRVTPSIKFTSNHLYTWMERGTVRVKCLAHEHNTMSLARARNRTTRSGDEHNSHKATVPPYQGCGLRKITRSPKVPNHEFWVPSSWYTWF